MTQLVLQNLKCIQGTIDDNGDDDNGEMFMMMFMIIVIMVMMIVDEVDVNIHDMLYLTF